MECDVCISQRLKVVMKMKKLWNEKDDNNNARKKNNEVCREKVIGFLWVKCFICVPLCFSWVLVSPLTSFSYVLLVHFWCFLSTMIMVCTWVEGLWKSSGSNQPCTIMQKCANQCSNLIRGHGICCTFHYWLFESRHHRFTRNNHSFKK